MSGLGDQDSERCCKPPNPRARHGTSTGCSAPNRNHAQRGDPEVLAARSYSERWASYLLCTAPMFSVTQSGEKFSMQFDGPEPSAGLVARLFRGQSRPSHLQIQTTRPTTCERERIMRRCSQPITPRVPAFTAETSSLTTTAGEVLLPIGYAS
jgi:hypothetical protein